VGSIPRYLANQSLKGLTVKREPLLLVKQTLVSILWPSAKLPNTMITVSRLYIKIHRALFSHYIYAFHTQACLNWAKDAHSLFVWLVWCSFHYTTSWMCHDLRKKVFSLNLLVQLFQVLSIHNHIKSYNNQLST
jgi:hypothetical protein